MPRTVWVLHGPNLDLLGTREPELYGRETLDQIDTRLKALGEELDLSVECFQSNHEGALIDRLAIARDAAAGCLINPGGYSHTSLAMADTIRAIDIPVIEVHLTNLYAREDERAFSVTGAAASGVIMGLGARGYELGLRELASRLKPARRRRAR